MEVILLGIYAFFAWLVFFKFKWLPWNIVTQVITITIPIIALTILILVLNIVAPSSADIRVMNYVVPINPRVSGKVIEVPVEPNMPVKKGDVLFKIDPVPFQIQVRSSEANIQSLQAQLITANANQRTFGEQLKAALSSEASARTQLKLAQTREKQFSELMKVGAGNQFDLEQAQTDLLKARNALESAQAQVQQVREKVDAKTADGIQDEVAKVMAQIAQGEAQLADAKWQLEQTVQYAPADGTVIALALRPGVMTTPFPAFPAMTFVENEQYVAAFFSQNEVRAIEAGNEAEIALKTYPGQIIKCEVESVVWATAQGQLPISGQLPNTGFGVAPDMRLAVKLKVTGEDAKLFLAPGARGHGAVYTNSGAMIHILRKIILRVGAKVDWLILKMH
ncbi:MAG: HlyD family secretion protein [Rhodanobacteraceae bacterium]|nr:HlyD family secretion protein [Rhodanobacteraceae bacterium]